MRIAPVAFILVLAVALRVPTLGVWSVWIDEAFTLHDALHDPPLYGLFYRVMRPVIEVFGSSELALRALPCLLGLATIGVLGTVRMAGVSVGEQRLAALFLALSSFHVFWSQSARYYTAQSLCLLLAFVALVPAGGAARESMHPGRIVLAALTTGLATLCHPSAMFFVPALLILALSRQPRRRAIVLASVGAVLSAVVVAYYWPILAEYRRNKGPGSLQQFVTSYGFLTGPVLLSAALVGLVAGVRRGPSPAAIVAVVPALSIAGMTWIVYATGYHAFATLPFVALLAARGCASLTGNWRTALTALVLVESLAGLALYHRSQGMRPRYREAAAVVAAAQAEGCVVFATQVPPLAYYLDLERVDLRTPAVPRRLASDCLDEFAAALAAEGCLCLLLHPDDLHGWSEEQRARFEALTQRYLPRRAEFPARFGPKQLSLTVFSSR